MNAITYVAGYLLRKCFVKHSCQNCRKELISNEFNSSNQLLCLFKGYEQNKDKPFGGLLNPTKTFVDYVASTEAKFIDAFTSNVDKLEVGNYLLSILPKFTIAQCAHFPSTYLLKLFVRMCIHYALKFGNRELRSAKKKNRKYLKVSHL
jgi:hypothetical protein